MGGSVADSNAVMNITTDIRIEALMKKIMSTILNKKKYKLEVEKEICELHTALKNILIDIQPREIDDDLKKQKNTCF